MEKADLLASIQAAEQEGRAAAEIVRRLIKLGILERGWGGWWGFYKYRKSRRGTWERVFVSVVNFVDGVVVWDQEIADPAKLLSTLVAKYRERNRHVREHLGKQLEEAGEAKAPGS